jgi:acetyl esterase
VERIAGVPYTRRDGRDLCVDIYRPVDRAAPLPVVVYLHGGGFRAMSKDTHWLMGLAFARQGHLVVLPDYRLGARHPFPAPAEDAVAAWTWSAANVVELGGDPRRMVVAGESAGANLAATLAVASAWARPEPWARAIFESAHRPRAAIPACGILQVSDTDRFRRHPRVVRSIIGDVARSYLPAGVEGLDLALADPLRVVETTTPDREPIPCFLPVGDRDPLMDDSHRMAAALRRWGGRAEARSYAGGTHAFHAFVWNRRARECWGDMFRFLDEAGGA